MSTPTALAPVTYQNIGAVTGFLLVKRGPSGSTVNIYNGDITNVLLVSRSPSPGLTNSIPIQPLTNATLDASQAMYGSAQSGQTVAEVVVSSATQLSPSPAQIAAQISALGLATAVNQGTQITAAGNTNNYLGGVTPGALISAAGLSVAGDMKHANSGVTTEIAALLAGGTIGSTPGGVPLLRFTNQLGSGNLQNLPISIPETLVNGVSVMQPGYEMWINFWFPVNAGTVPFANMRFQWADSVTGLNIKSQNFVLTAGNAQANAISYYLNGPCFGDQLFITLTNLDPAIAGTYSFVINQTSHLFQHDSILQPGYATGAAPFGFTNPNGTPGLGVLATVVTAIAASASVDRLLAVCSGKVFVEVDNLGGANACRIRMLDPSAGNIYGSGSANQSFYSNTIAATSSVGQEVALPNGPVLLELHNNGASGSITPAVTITIEDY